MFTVPVCVDADAEEEDEAYSMVKSTELPLPGVCAVTLAISFDLLGSIPLIVPIEYPAFWRVVIAVSND